MAHYFSYDRLKHAHTVFAVEVKDENDKVLGFRAVVTRVPKGGGLNDNVSERFGKLKYICFSSEKAAIEHAVVFFSCIDRTVEGDSDTPVPEVTNMQELMPKIKVDILQCQEEARRVIALATGEVLRHHMDEWARENDTYIQESWFELTRDTMERFKAAMNEWRDSVSNLQEAKAQLSTFSE